MHFIREADSAGNKIQIPDTAMPQRDRLVPATAQANLRKSSAAGRATAAPALPRRSPRAE
jgi:hypothetical protein